MRYSIYIAMCVAGFYLALSGSIIIHSARGSYRQGAGKETAAGIMSNNVPGSALVAQPQNNVILGRRGLRPSICHRSRPPALSKIPRRLYRDVNASYIACPGICHLWTRRDHQRITPFWRNGTHDIHAGWDLVLHSNAHVRRKRWTNNAQWIATQKAAWRMAEEAAEKAELRWRSWNQWLSPLTTCLLSLSPALLACFIMVVGCYFVWNNGPFLNFQINRLGIASFVLLGALHCVDYISYQGKIRRYHTVINNNECNMIIIMCSAPA